jgi:type IV pilus assembly protein PilV
MHVNFQSKAGFRSARVRSSGVSLIEVLVSVAISSIGLLALAGVNAASVRYTKMSQYRATATLLATDIAERMRANKGIASPASGFYSGAYDYAVDFDTQATKATLPTEKCDAATSNCSSAQIAALDLAQWRISVRDQLPVGSVFLKRQATQIAMDVWLVWRDPAVASADESPALVGECPTALTTNGDLSIRCSYFRINL